MIDIKKLEKALKIAELLDGCETPKSAETWDGYYIVRTYSAGVFAGTVVSKNGKEVVMKDARRLWQWSGAASLSQLAQEGTKNPGSCKFPQPVDSVMLTEAIEILKCTDAAEASIKAVAIWKM